MNHHGLHVLSPQRTKNQKVLDLSLPNSSLHTNYKEEKKDISVVIPLFNEAEGIRILGEKLSTELTKMGKTYEVIFVDDGSRDDSFQELKNLKQNFPEVKIIKLRTNQGKSIAYGVGFECSKGKYVITMDGDLQDDPSDISNLIRKIEEGYDAVIGWKYTGKGSLSRTIPSRCFNFLVSLLTGLRIHDVNCPLRILRRDVLKHIRLYGELYRFIPILLHRRGYRIAELRVTNNPRRFGRSKYGIGRFMRGILDFMTLIFLNRYTDRPLHLFGYAGVLFFLAGFGVDAYFSLKGLLITGRIGHQAAMLMGVFLMIVGIQFISIGLLGELMINRLESRNKDYNVEDIVE